MRGIVAVIGSREAAPLLLEGLRQLEYRGYDSAGIATVNGERQLSYLRAEGKLVNLTTRYEEAGDFQERCRRWAPIQAACWKSKPSSAVVSSLG